MVDLTREGETPPLPKPKREGMNFERIAPFRSRWQGSYF